MGAGETEGLMGELSVGDGVSPSAHRKNPVTLKRFPPLFFH